MRERGMGRRMRGWTSRMFSHVCENYSCLQKQVATTWTTFQLIEDPSKDNMSQNKTK